MATELRKLAWMVPLPEAGQKAVLVLLCDLPLKGTVTCTPGRDTIVQRCSLGSMEALDAALKALRERGLVSWVRREKTSNEYTVDVEHLKAQAVVVPGGARREMATATAGTTDTHG